MSLIYIHIYYNSFKNHNFNFKTKMAVLKVFNTKYNNKRNLKNHLTFHNFWVSLNIYIIYSQLSACICTNTHIFIQDIYLV